MTELIGNIKLILKPFATPKNPANDYLIAKRLGESHLVLLQVKRSYPTDFKMVRSIVFLKDYKSMPLWMDDLISILSLYLDTYILRTKYLPPNYVEPIACYTVLGQENQVDLVKHYLTYLYGSINAFYALQHTINLANTDNITDDVRKESSKYRKTLIKSIVSRLNNLLEEAKINQRDAFYKGLSHQERIDKFLRAKFTNQWRQNLLKHI